MKHLLRPSLPSLGQTWPAVLGASVALMSGAAVRTAVAQTAAPVAPPTTAAVPVAPAAPAAPATPAAPVIETPDTPGVIWAPASPQNFRAANRPVTRPIDMIIIHDIEGTALSAVNWFQNPKAGVAAHYVVDAEGRVWQMVKERDIGWHAGNRDINERSVGIEMEGYAYRPGFYSPTLYETVARLTRSISTRHNIPRDRTRIISHAEVPHPTKPGSFGGASAHTDPGPYWNWERFMTLVRNDARLESKTLPEVIRPGEVIEVVANFINSGDDAWPAANGKRNDAVQAMGPVYLGASESAGRASAFFHIKSWTSPRFASPPRDGDTAPGATGRFTFSLQGPRALGTYAESFRLMKVPVAPREPVAFGERLWVMLRVEPWDIVSSATHPGFAAPDWDDKTIGGQRIFWRRTVPESRNRSATTAPATSEQATGAQPTAQVAQAPVAQPDKMEPDMVAPPVAATQPVPAQPSSSARWKVELPISGEWDVYARWPAGKGRSARAWYEVAASDGARRVAVDQRKHGGQWFKLGRFRFDRPKDAAVTLLPGGASGSVVAESVRFVGPFSSP